MGLALLNCIGLVLIVSGLSKVTGFTRFRAAVADYRVVPTLLVTPVARLVAGIEVALAVALLTGVADPVGWAGAATTFLVFGGAMSVNLMRGRVIDCGCGAGDRGHPVSWWLVGRNVLLAGAALAGGMLAGTPGWDTRLPTLVTAASAGLVFAVGSVAVRVRRHPALAGVAW